MQNINGADTSQLPMPIIKAISEKEAAQRYPYSVKWYQRMRWQGGGPPYIKVRGRVMYPLMELDEWFSGHGLRTSTSATEVKGECE